MRSEDFAGMFPGRPFLCEDAIAEHGEGNVSPRSIAPIWQASEQKRDNQQRGYYTRELGRQNGLQVRRVSGAKCRRSQENLLQSVSCLAKMEKEELHEP